MPLRKRKPSLIPSLLPDILNPMHRLRVMGRLVRRRVKQPGTPPGTLVHPGPPPVEEVRITAFQYGPDDYEEREVAGVEALFPFPDPPTVTWVDIEGLHDVEAVREVGERLSIHALVLEDIVSPGQRPKVEEHEHYLYVVLPMLRVEPGTGTIQDQQVSLVLGAGYVLTFQEHPGDAFHPVRERIRNRGARIRGRGADYLAYALVDTVVDGYFSVLETVGDVAEQLEAEVLQAPGRETMHRLHALKREMLMVRRAVWPVREMVHGLVRTESPLVTEATRVFLRDVYDHAVRILDTVELLRDVVVGMIDLYLTIVFNRTNEVMKTLTIMASIFIPLTFIAGVYGMNFEFMPELEVRWAYPALLGLMLTLALGMLWQFKRRGWW